MYVSLGCMGALQIVTLHSLHTKILCHTVLFRYAETYAGLFAWCFYYLPCQNPAANNLTPLIIKDNLLNILSLVLQLTPLWFLT